MTCLDLKKESQGGLDSSGWYVQTCNDMPMPMGDDPSQSCFTWTNWDEDLFNKTCEFKTGMTPRHDFALDFFGGRDVALDWEGTSNIIWSNGEYDPWHAGGVLEDVNPENYVFFMPESAHHLDLRTPNEADPIFVKQTREREEKIIKGWIEEYQNQVI